MGFWRWGVSNNNHSICLQRRAPASLPGSAECGFCRLAWIPLMTALLGHVVFSSPRRPAQACSHGYINILRRWQQKLQGLLRLGLRSHIRSLISTAFHWSKQVAGLAQIPGQGKHTSWLDRRRSNVQLQRDKHTGMEKIVGIIFVNNLSQRPGGSSSLLFIHMRRLRYEEFKCPDQVHPESVVQPEWGLRSAASQSKVFIPSRISFFTYILYLLYW